MNKQLPGRLESINDNFKKIEYEIDSLEKSNRTFNDEIAKKPEILSRKDTIIYIREPLPDGTFQWIPRRITTYTSIPNTRIDEVKRNDERLKELREDQGKSNNEKKDIEEKLRNELKAKIGFLEELDAMIDILTERREALIFYALVFLFLLSLELFVVVSKWGDTKCDYDFTIENQLKIRKNALEELVKKK